MTHLDRQAPEESEVGGGALWLLATDRGSVIIRNDIWDDGYEGITHTPVWTVGATTPTKYCFWVSGAESADIAPRSDEAWVFDAMRAGDRDGPKYLEAVVDGINRQIAKRSFRLIDQILADAEPSEMSRHILLALARGTYPVRSKLSAWKPFLDATAEAFEKRGLNAKKLLAGLMDRDAPA